MTKFHKTQKAYIAAKALHETIAAQVQEEMNAYDYLLEEATDESFEKHARLHVEAEHRLGYWTSFDLLRSAEDAMVQWAMAKVRTIPQAQEQQEMFEEILSKWNSKKLLPSYRAKIVDISAHLRA